MTAEIGELVIGSYRILAPENLAAVPGWHLLAAHALQPLRWLLHTVGTGCCPGPSAAQGRLLHRAGAGC